MLLIVGVILLVILSAAAIAVFMTSGNKSNNNGTSGTTDEDTDSTSSSTFTLSTNKEVSFIAPSNMSGYVKGSNFEDTIGDYTTKDNSCNLQYGVVSSDELPGYSIEDAATYQLGLAAEGVTITQQPKDIGDLKLKDEKKDVTYTMKSIEVAFTRNNTSYISNYSFAILPGNNRAYLRTYCSNDNGSASSSSLKKINEKAKEVKVRTTESE
jgi:hypothetical protein